MRRRLMNVAVLLSTVGIGVFAQEGGGVPIRVGVDDGVADRCVDATKDRIWLTLRRLVTTKKANWFVKDNAVAVVVNAQIKTDPQPPKALTFPLSTTAKFGDTPTGQVSVPIEYGLVSGLALTQGLVTYTGLGADIILVNARDPSRLGSAIQSLAQITGSGKLPIPPSPFTTGATYLLDFANTAITNDITKAPDKSTISGALAMNFDPDGVCNGDFEKTGTKAFVYSEGTQGNLIDIQHTGEYCFSAELTPVFSLKAAKKQPGTECTDNRYKNLFVDVTNNYVAFYLNKRPISTVAGPTPLGLRDRREALQRCQANGISDERQCPGAN